MSPRADAHTRTNNVIHAAFTPKAVDGGKARIKRQRDLKFRLPGPPVRDVADDLMLPTVDSAPCEMPVG
ncbi:MAG: hypothetical protein CFE29_03125 [Bradyrhizobiaceae bacterium PARB1]|jgi:cytochrome P450|nr:MAG: hypothetical protein CFE29_03125 [Bradyrhizobiaceae bacterium PARB1]